MRSSPVETVVTALDEHQILPIRSHPRRCQCGTQIMGENAWAAHQARVAVDALQDGGYVVMSDDELARTVTHTLTIEKQFANGPKVPAATLVSNLGLVRTTLLDSIEECSKVARGA